MPTQEEKITVLEENITILLGIASRQERDITNMKGVMSLVRPSAALEGRLYRMVATCKHPGKAGTHRMAKAF